MERLPSFRILIVDDNKDIHEDIIKIIKQSEVTELDKLSAKLFDYSQPIHRLPELEIDSAYQGTEGIEKVKHASESAQPYALAFVDVRMPPGMDGIKVISQLWKIDNNIEIVICTAYSDYSFEEISQELNISNQYFILKKPFDAIEIRQLVSALLSRWSLKMQVKKQLENLNLLNNYLNYSLSVHQSTLDAIEEGIVVINADRRITAYNKKFLRICNISERTLKQGFAEDLFQLLAQQKDDPVAFLDVIREMYQNPKIESSIEWKAVNGKQLEIYAHPQILNQKMIGTLLAFREIAHHKELEAELLHNATHDQLTGLPNRVMLKNNLNYAISLAKQNNLKIGVVLVGLDNFKIVNDTLGHDKGDVLLRQIVSDLSRVLMESEILVRLGGDEFVFLCKQMTSNEYLQEKAKSILALFSHPYVLDNINFPITASIGISIYPYDGLDTATLLKSADVVLYHAKEEGKNKSKFYKREYGDRVNHSERSIELQAALDKNELILNFQPILEYQNKKIIGSEVILKWNHPNIGVISFNNFLPLAEQIGIACTICQWMLRKSFEQHQKWLMNYPALIMTVNVFSYCFRNDHFIEIITNAIQEAQLNPKTIEFQITENLLLESHINATKKLDALKELGSRVSITDSGTGYTNLDYLKFLPINKIKIAKPIQPEAQGDRSYLQTVKNIFAMSKARNLDVLVEEDKKIDLTALLGNLSDYKTQVYDPVEPMDTETFTSILQKEKNKAEKV